MGLQCRVNYSTWSPTHSSHHLAQPSTTPTSSSPLALLFTLPSILTVGCKAEVRVGHSFFHSLTLKASPVCIYLDKGFHTLLLLAAAGVLLCLWDLCSHMDCNGMSCHIEPTTPVCGGVQYFSQPVYNVSIHCCWNSLACGSVLCQVQLATSVEFGGIIWGFRSPPLSSQHSIVWNQDNCSSKNK